MSLAHEGNPKEDSITIKAGEVTSTATLTVQFSGGGGGGVTNPIPPVDTSDHCSCEQSQTATPCTTDYMLYCYDGNMVQWSNNPLQLLFSVGGGCAGGSQVRSAIAASGVNSVGLDCSLGGGFALYYGELNPNQIGASGHVVDAAAMELRNFTSKVVFGNVIGSPAFGIALNVPQHATCSTFSGLVLLFDWGTNLVTLGSYSNADLNNGDLPISIATVGAIPDLADLDEVVLQNGYKSGGVRVIEVFMNGWNTYSFANEYSPAESFVDTTVGFGFFWLRSPARVNPSSLTVSYDENTEAVLTFV